MSSIQDIIPPIQEHILLSVYFPGVTGIETFKRSAQCTITPNKTLIQIAREIGHIHEVYAEIEDYLRRYKKADGSKTIQLKNHGIIWVEINDNKWECKDIELFTVKGYGDDYIMYFTRCNDETFEMEEVASFRDLFITLY